MNHYLTEIELGDPCSWTLLALLLIFIGKQMVDGRPAVHTWGLRLGVAAFIGFAVYQLLRHPYPDSQALLTFALRSLLASGVALGTGWICLPVLAYLYRVLLAKPAEDLQRWVAESRRASAERHSQRAADERRRRERADAGRAAIRHQRQAEEQRKQHTADQKRREDARAACEFLYHRHAHALTSRLPPAIVTDFVAKYLSDAHPPEFVEERAGQLQEIILSHVHQIAPPLTPCTIESLAAWYKVTKELIDGLPVETRYKQSQLAQLNARYAELMQELMDNLRP